MNFSRNSISSEAASRKRKKNRRQKQAAVLILRSVLVFILVLIAALLIVATIYVKRLIKNLPDASTINITPVGYASKIYDKDGNEIESLVTAGSNREYVTLDKIPKDLQHAFIAMEDSRFYKHNGVDIKGILRAGVTGLLSHGQVAQGASTITQQLLKNNYFTTWTSEKTIQDKIERKIQEQVLAIRLEKVTSKDKILENYLNTINLGQNTLGVQAAAKRYFNKDVNDLTLSEDAVIAGITQNPSKYNPIKDPRASARRRTSVLTKMLDQGFITKTQYKEALNDDVYDRIQTANTDVLADSQATSYFEDALINELVQDLQDKLGYTETQAYHMIYSGGLKVYSTQDQNIQNIADTAVNNPDNYGKNTKYSFSYRLTVKKADGTLKNYSEQTMLSYYKKNNPNYDIDFNSKEEAQAAIDKYKSEIMSAGDTIPSGGETVTFTLQPQAAMTIMDQSTGKVVALVGGRGDKTANKTLNRATDTERQPGSTFKILSTYAPALDSAGLTLATVQDNAPYSYPNGQKVHNMPDTYTGYTTIRDGIKNSINIVAIKTMDEIGTSLGFQYVQDFGITTLTSGDNNLAMAIGGLSKGVKNIELTAAFATIADKGVYHKPIFYTKVVDHKGETLLSNENTDEDSKKVIKESTAWLLTSAMQDVMSQGTGKAANLSNMHCAGKTGTTNDAKDSLLMGFTPYYTCGVWGGYDDASSQDTTAYTKRIWHEVMQNIHSGLEDKDFDKPDGIVEASVCRESGKTPVAGLCDSDPRGSTIYTEYFADGTQPTDTETCDKHVKVTICTESGQIAGPYCPVTTSSVKILGDVNGSNEDQYRITQDELNTTCTVHTGMDLSSLIGSGTRP